MTMNPLPPQAYTKDTLVQAYSWVQNQNESIKELATTPDVLVSLYLKAKLQGESVLERPSIQNFKNELKSLAGMMGEFQASEPTPRTQVPSPKRAMPAAQPAETAPITTAAPMTAATSPTPISALDPKTLETLAEIRQKLNLSSENEALRVLVQLGAAQIRKISP